jgi:hypothetical protein
MEGAKKMTKTGDDQSSNEPMRVTDMTPQQLDAVVAAETNRALADRSVYPGMEVKHRTGGHYTVVCAATIEATLEPAVVYRSAKDHAVWIRPLAEFCDGRFAGI